MLQAIRTELASRFTGGYATEPTQANSPCAIVAFPEISFDETLGGVMQINLRIRLGINTSSEKNAETALLTQLEAATSKVLTPGPWRAIKVDRSGTPYIQAIGQGNFLFVDLHLTIHA